MFFPSCENLFISIHNFPVSFKYFSIIKNFYLVTDFYHTIIFLPISHDSPTSSVSSLHSLNAAAGTSSLATAALKPSIPSLTPSLANYYREDLISHVVGWQADHAERQVSVCFIFCYFINLCVCVS